MTPSTIAETTTESFCRTSSVPEVMETLFRQAFSSTSACCCASSRRMFRYSTPGLMAGWRLPSIQGNRQSSVHSAPSKNAAAASHSVRLLRLAASPPAPTTSAPSAAEKPPNCAAFSANQSANGCRSACNDFLTLRSNLPIAPPLYTILTPAKAQKAHKKRFLNGKARKSIPTLSS